MKTTILTITALFLFGTGAIADVFRVYVSCGHGKDQGVTIHAKSPKQARHMAQEMFPGCRIGDAQRIKK
jgi:hypothetical protein